MNLENNRLKGGLRDISLIIIMIIFLTDLMKYKLKIMRLKY